MYRRDKQRYPFKDIKEFEEYYGLQPYEKCWKPEVSVGKDNATPITYDKLFSYDDITKAMQGELNDTYTFQRVLDRLQSKIENK